MKPMMALAALLVLGTLAGVLDAAAPGGEAARSEADLELMDRVFMELESLGAGLERCINDKAGVTQAVSAPSQREASALPAPEPSTGAFQLAGASLSPERRKLEEKGRKAVAICQAGFAMNYHDKELASFLRRDGNDELQVRYQSCLALARKSPAACEELKRAGFEHTARECRIGYETLVLVRALATGDPKASSLCLAAANSPGEKAVSSPGACAELLGRRDLAQLCPESAFAQSDFRKFECILALALSGKAGACERFDPITQGWEQRGCRNYAAYSRALAAGDAGLCGELPICRALMGEGASSCQIIAEQVRDKYCRRLAAPVGPAPRASTSPMTAAGERELQERKARLSELSAKQDLAVEQERRRVRQSELAAAAQAGRVDRLREFHKVNDACLKTSREIQDRLDDVYKRLGLFEPKGHPGHKRRVERYFELQGLHARRVQRLQDIKNP